MKATRIAQISLLLTAWSALYPLQAQSLRTVSQPTRTSATGAGNSFTPSFRADGHYVIFVSQARNLVTNDNHWPYLNVYVQDLGMAHATLVSVNGSGFGGGDGNASAPAISSNGQFIVFQSDATNLDRDDTNRASDIFARDLDTDTTTLVSVSTNGTSSGNGPSTTPLLSSDGRRVIFESAATDLVPGDTNGFPDIFARDLSAGSTLLVSADATAAGAGNGASDTPMMSSDGHWVAFIKRATNVLSGVTSFGEIYLRDLQAESTVWISSVTASYFTNSTNGFRCSDPAISADGSVVAFLAGDITTDRSLLFRYDGTSPTATLVSSNVPTGYCPTFSADGRYLAYVSGESLYVWDALAGSNRVASACGPGGAAIDSCRAPVFAADGSRVAFIGAQNGQLAVYAYNVATDCSQVVSVGTNGTARSPVAPSVPAISDDGRLVAYESPADDIVPGDFNQSADIFVRDLVDGTTRLISRRADLRPALSGVKPMTLGPNSASADGSVIAFAGLDNELTEGDTNPWQDVYVEDLKTGQLARVSAGSGTAPGSWHFGAYPALSADGRYLSYLQNSTNVFWIDLATGASKRVENAASQSAFNLAGYPLAPWDAISPDGRFVAFTGADFALYRRDMWSDNATNEVLSAPSGRDSPALPASFAPVYSADGQWVAFVSSATRLVTNVIHDIYEVYARRLDTKTTRLVSYYYDQTGMTSGVTNAVFSADSRFLFFQSRLYDAGPPNMLVYRHDLLTETTNDVVCHYCWNPSPSADGQLVAVQTFRLNFTQGGTPPDDVFVVNTQTGQSNLVSVNLSGTGGGNGSSGTPLISYDGHYVVFVSKASNLVPDDTNNAADLFVRDLWRRTTMLVSRNIQGNGSGNALSSTPVLSADGRTVFFQSFASDLVPGDFNQARDIFALKLSGQDGDGDGMDDDWEMAYFNTLTRDGHDDFDQDGQTDLEEFRAGTNPANDESILRVLTLAPLRGGGRTLFWSATPGRRYRVEYKADAKGVNWLELPGTVTAMGTTASQVDAAAGTEHRRFYRVRLLP